MAQLNDIFYFGIILDYFGNYEYADTEIQHIKEFLHNQMEKYVEYKVKLIEICDDKQNKRIYYHFEILEIYKNDEELDNNIGTKISAWSEYKNSDDILNKKLSKDPYCLINDEDNLNCIGCYVSLIIPWNIYLTEINLIDLESIEFVHQIKMQIDKLNNECINLNKFKQAQKKNKFILELGEKITNYLSKIK